MTECCVCSKPVEHMKSGFLNDVFGGHDPYWLCGEDLERVKRFLNIKQLEEEK